MKHNTSNRKEKKADRPSKRLRSKNLISIDQPFDYEEVAMVTGPEYIQLMNRDGMVFNPYEKVKKNIPGFYLPEDKCVWMRAGVINLRLCDYDYDCYHCPFDEAMSNAMGDKAAPKKKERSSNWAKHVKTRYQITSTPCIHFLSGRIASPEECSGDYMCHHCTVHELLDKESRVVTTDKPEHKNVSGYKMVEDYFYHFGHSWVNIEKFRRVRIGIDDFISKILGPADEINLPPVGTVMKQGEIGCILTRNDKKAPVQSPMSGTVYAVNGKVKKNPELAHDDSFSEGWLYMLDAENLKPELAGLYSGRECFQWMEKESQNLYELMGPRYKQLAATGGEPIDDIYGHFPEMNWDRLVRTFLHMAENR
jgi:glycine cleavage system H lipoate-binding protein